MSSIASRLVYVAVAIAAYFAYIGFELEESHTSGGLEKRAASMLISGSERLELVSLMLVLSLILT